MEAAAQAASPMASAGVSVPPAAPSPNYTPPPPATPPVPAMAEGGETSGGSGGGIKAFFSDVNVVDVVCKAVVVVGVVVGVVGDELVCGRGGGGGGLRGAVSVPEF